MKKTFFSLTCLFLISFPDLSSSRELNFIESHLFRLSGYTRPEEWLIPFYRAHPNSYPEGSFQIFLATHPDTWSVIEDAKSKDQTRIQSLIDQNYGQPFDASAKVTAFYRYQYFQQSIAANAGAVAIVSDPVFPEISGIFFQDYTMTSAYFHRFDKNFTILPKLIYGVRRVLDSSFTVIELVGERPDTKLKNRPWKGFVELSLQAKYQWTYFEALLEFNSIPLSSQDYKYWDSNLGVRSKNLVKHLGNLPLQKMDLYLMYSPFYGGYYDVSRTMKTGLGVEMNENWMADLFFQDEFLFGVLAKYSTEHFSASIFTHERSYDDFHTQKSRQYGLLVEFKL